VSMEEEALGKAYDARIIRRLLGYARPYVRELLLAVLMAFFVTVADLSRPYLIKVAIDSHIDTLSTPMVRYEPGRNPVPGVAYAGGVYVRLTDLGHRPAPAGPRYELVAVGGRHLLVRGTPKLGPGARYGRGQLIVGGRRYPARLLSTAQFERFRAEDVRALFLLALLYFLAILVAFGCNYGQTWLLEWVGQNAILSMRERLMRHLEHLPLAFFDRHPVGRLVTRVTNDIEAVNEMYRSVLVNVVKDVFVLGGVILVMVRLNLRLALLSFAVIPLILVSAYFYRTLARQAYRLTRVAIARINAFLAENITGMRLIQAFHREERQRERFRLVNRQYLAASFRELTVFSVFRPLMGFLNNLAVALLLWFGGGFVLQHLVTLGVLYAFINYVNLFFQPINDITDKYNILQQAMAAAERVFLLADTPNTLTDPPRPVVLAEPKGRVDFDHVHFAYKDEHWVLRDITFTVEPGETVAFVGATGAGKTSIMHLLARFYDVQRGAIRIDGVDIRDLAQADLRRIIGMVQQDVFLFSGTIRSNITLGHPFSDEEVREACRLVRADRFIERLPHGYDEPVLERGATLSTGQRQLIAFARALIHRPRILVLDEATANIDTETEAWIQEAIRAVAEGRTMLVVAHRLSTVQNADRIIVLQKGRIREMGTHQELLSQGGLYYDLYRLQYGLPADVPARAVSD
jgi:ATP-binding cassette subfamily B multidrug efflux pump